MKIRPTRYGIVFLILLLGMFAGSINYNNNLGYLLTFLLGGIALVSMAHTYRGIAGLRILSCTAEPVFAGEQASFEMVADVANLERCGIKFRLSNGSSAALKVAAGSSGRIKLQTPATSRGLLKPWPIQVYTEFPLGLFRVQSQLDPECGCTVYPRPVNGGVDLQAEGTAVGTDGGLNGPGADDFQGLKGYMPGDPLKRISWKASSRGRGLFTKDFNGHYGTCGYLDWYSIDGHNTEHKLSLLSHAVIDHHRRRLVYGLKLPGKSIAPGSGSMHRKRCLTALALMDSSRDRLLADENPRSGAALKFVPDKNLGPLVLALAIALGPHVFQLPIWVVLWCVICWCYLLAAARYNFPRPGKIMRLALTMGGIFLVMLNSGGSLDRFSSVALLWIMASIKPMEIRSYRDEMVTVFMVYFLAVSGLFFSSSLAAGLSVAASICTTTAVLIHLHHPGSGPGANLRLSARLFLKALPLALILFMFFPRIQGSIWGFRNETFATSGFSDRLAPGDVTDLVRDNAIAFRVKFENRIPEPEQLYWRGLVFLRFDGRAWHLNDHAIQIAQQINGRDSRDYTITLEPHNHHWLFALDLPYFSDSNIIILSDQTLISRWKVKRRIQYRLKSYTSYVTGPLRQWESAALKIPYNQNPLIAGNQPGRNAGRTHQIGEGRCKMFAVAFAGPKQKIIDGCFSQRRGI